MTINTLPSIDLQDPESVRIDPEARTLAFFCKKKPLQVDRKLILQLKEALIERDVQAMRLCLHESPDAAFHEMIVLERKGNWHRPHRHPTKGESYHIIEGKLAAITFDNDGSVNSACVMEPNGSFMHRMEADTYHTLITLSDLVIYCESKPGPFVRENNLIFADWAPDGEQVADFIQNLQLQLEI